MMLMQELKIYLNKEKTQQIEDVLVLEKVVAGEVTRQSIFIENVINYPIDMELKLEGEDIIVIDEHRSVSPGKLEEVEFEITPSLTAMVPISAKLNIKLNYVVK